MKRSGLGEVRTQAGEAGLVYAGADELGVLALAPPRRAKGRFPVPESAVSVGDALQLHDRDVVLHRQRGVEDAIRRDVVAVGKREQLLADVVAVLEEKAAHAADLVGRLAGLDARLAHRRMPERMAVEVAQHFPDARDGRVDDRRASDPDQRSFCFRESNAAWNTSWPICRASWPSRSGAQSNSAHHSAK